MDVGEVGKFSGSRRGFGKIGGRLMELTAARVPERRANGNCIGRQRTRAPGVIWRVERV